MGNSFTRRQFLKQTAAAGAASILAGCLPGFKPISKGVSGSKSAQPPNILFISVDDLRTQLGCYGHSHTISPHIDQLAAEGILFERAYCQMPVCGPSRASLMTGLRPSKNRFRQWRADRGAPYAVTLGRHFKSHGYLAINNGKIFHSNSDSANGWSRPPWRVYDYDTQGQGDWAAVHFDKIWLDPESKKNRSKIGRGPYWESADVPDDAYEDGQVAAKCIEDLRQMKKSGQPFFLACGFHRPHLPFNAPKKYYDLYDPSQIDLASNRFDIADRPPECRNSNEITQYARVEGWPNGEKFHRTARHAYYACVSYVDALIGSVLSELKSLDLDKNTLVILWGDHGWLLGEHNFWGKHNTLHETLRVPLIIRVPGGPANVRIQSIIELVDLYPTLCEWCGLPFPESHQLDGQSFMPLLKNPQLPWKEAAFSEWGKGKSIITDRYLYTEWDSGSKMLFDHQKDPFENVNLAHSLEFAQTVKYLNRLVKTVL
jgi:arylsulfatase A-like enzyme